MNKKTIVRDKAMLNVIWCIMIAVAVIYAAFKGDISQLNNAILDAPGEGVTLCITMLGIMCLWMGIMEIAMKSGVIEKLTKLFDPIMQILFPSIPKDSKAREYIAANFIANILGLGWAATPVGLKAMEELRKINNDSDVASCDICTFLIINISSLQLIPINIIAYRSQYGAVNPSSIIGFSIVSTLISTFAGVCFAIVARKIANKKMNT